MLPTRQAWIENMILGANSPTVGMMSLHPDVFGTNIRLDFIHLNVVWQKRIRMIEYRQPYSRHEVPISGRKPWPQKGTGRARHGTRRSPIFKGGGVCHGPRKYTTKFCMLPYNIRVFGLVSALSARFAQDDLKIVENLEIPTDDSKYIEKFCDERLWGPSVLFVDEPDIMPRNISLATKDIGHLNLMPYYGLNVYGIMKHDTLVLTVAAAKKLQDILYRQLNRPDMALCMGAHKNPDFEPNGFIPEPRSDPPPKRWV